MGVKLRKRGDKWWVFINHRGRRKAKAIGPDKRTAEIVAEKIRARLVFGDFQLRDDSPEKFRDYTERWIDTYARVHLKESTIREYSSVIKHHLNPVFGNLAITEITREAIKRLIAEKIKAGLSRGTIRNIIAPLREMLNHAVEDGILPSNPATRIGRFYRGKIEQEAKKFDYLNREELAHLLRITEESYPNYYPLILCAARTGMRQGELFALQWGDIDFEGRFIEVRRSFHKGQVSSPKSGRVRRVDMSKQLTQVLMGLRDIRLAEMALKGKDLEPTALVFCNRDGGYLDSGHFYSRVWQPLLRKAGLRHIRFHDLRHTYASLLIQQGESLAYIRDQLGHYSIQMTVDIYGHLVPGANREAVDRLDDADATIRNLYATKFNGGLENWLGSEDSNLGRQIQSLQSYH